MVKKTKRLANFLNTNLPLFNKGVLTKLILVNATLFLFANIGIAVLHFTNSDGVEVFYQWLSLSSSSDIFVSHFWTIITYMFLHVSFLHFFFNMMWLYWMGDLFMSFIGKEKLVATYFIGGIVGGLFFLLFSSLLPMSGNYLVGASASVMAIVIVLAIYVPNFTLNLMFIGEVKLKYVAIASFVLTTVLDFSDNTGGKLAHVGGALTGVLLGVFYKKGIDLTAFPRKLFSSIATIFSSNKNNMKVAYKRKLSDEEYNLNKKAEAKRLDDILDKISRSGYESLTKEEKNFLFKQSQQNK